MWIKVNENIVEARKNQNDETRSINLFFFSFMFMFSALLILRFFFFTSVIVNGSSMDKTLEDKDILLVNKVIKPSRGDIVVFYAADIDENGNINYHLDSYGNKTFYIKRLIADSGDTIYWEDGDVSIGYETDYGSYNIKLKEDYVTSETYTFNFWGDNTQGIYVPDNYFFAMGDNRINSNDSRGTIGLVDKRLVLGVVSDFVVQRKETLWVYLFRIF